jgi:hypothetical protein
VKTDDGYVDQQSDFEDDLMAMAMAWMLTKQQLANVTKETVLKEPGKELAVLKARQLDIIGQLAGFPERIANLESRGRTSGEHP